MLTTTTLKKLITFSKDGEWGKDKDLGNYVQMYVIRGTDFSKVRAGSYKGIPVRWIPEKKAIYKAVEPEDVLIELAGGTENNPTGRTCFVSKEYVANSPLPITVASFSRLIRLDRNKCNPRYVYWMLQFMHQYRIIKKYHLQHTGTARFQWTDFSTREKLQLHPFDQQRRIAAILSAYDDLIENNLARIRLLESTAEEIYREWFVRLRFPGWQTATFHNAEGEVVPHGTEGALPEGWERVKVVDAFEITGGGTPSTTEKGYWHEGDIDWYSPTDITASKSIFMFGSKSKITQKGLSKSSAKLFPANCVMMTSRATIGAIGINATEACTNQGFITCIPNNKFPYQYIFEWIKSNAQLIDAFAYGSTFKEINKGDFRNFRIVKVDFSLMKVYVESVKSLFTQIKTLQQKNTLLAQTRDLLLPRLMSGRLDVSEVTLPDAKQPSTKQ